MSRKYKIRDEINIESQVRKSKGEQPHRWLIYGNVESDNSPYWQFIEDMSTEHIEKILLQDADLYKAEMIRELFKRIKNLKKKNNEKRKKEFDTRRRNKITGNH